MSSGLYSALSGASARMGLMDTITDNLANLKTAGFKKGVSRFESLLQEVKSGPGADGINFAQMQGGFTDFQSGPLTRTGVPSHLAIEGEGFFRVADQDGNVFFTRQGNLRREVTGNLVTASGLQVLDEGGAPLVLPGAEIVIDAEGQATLEDGEVKRIPVYTFDDQALLLRNGGGLFTPAPGATPRLLERPHLIQGHIEESNVSMMEETTRLMEAMRAFEACQKMMKTYDTLAGKADEIGSVG